MALPRVPEKLPERIDATKSWLAYGDLEIPKLRRELDRQQELITRQRALRSLCDVMHNPLKVCQALREGVPESLKALLTDKDNTIRMLATEVFFILSSAHVARMEFLNLDVIIPLSKLFTDPVFEVRRNSHQTLEMIAKIRHGAEGIVNSGLMRLLVGRICPEEDEIKDIILDTLHHCLAVDTQEALRADMMTDLVTLLRSPLPNLRAKAARDIMDLAFPLEGKEKACEMKIMPSLVGLLEDVVPEVRAQSAGAIMAITITTEGKQQALAVDAISALVRLLDDQLDQVILNSLKAITCLAEAPEGRKALHEALPQLSALEHHGNATICRSASRAIAVITWKP